MKLSWTQAICARCWWQMNPEREPVRVTFEPLERCCICGEFTRDGIYVRRDPTTVPYPRRERE